MKIFFIFLFILLITLSSNAYALPKWTQKYTENWIKNHKFLSPTILDSMEGFGASRILKDDFFIEVYFYPDIDGKIYKEELFLEKKKYTKQETANGHEGVWITKGYKNIWNRNNKTSFELLNKIYGQKIASDFKNATYIYSGDEYILYEPTEYYRHKIAPNFLSLLKDKNNASVYPSGKLIYLWGKSSFYKGNLFVYEVIEEPKEKLFYLRISELTFLKNDIETLKHNKQMYLKYIQYLKQKKDKQEEIKKRYQPAEIKIQ